MGRKRREKKKLMGVTDPGGGLRGLSPKKKKISSKFSKKTEKGFGL